MTNKTSTTRTKHNTMKRTAATPAAAIADTERETHYNNITFIVLKFVSMPLYYQMKENT